MFRAGVHTQWVLSSVGHICKNPPRTHTAHAKSRHSRHAHNTHVWPPMPLSRHLGLGVDVGARRQQPKHHKTVQPRRRNQQRGVAVLGGLGVKVGTLATRHRPAHTQITLQFSHERRGAHGRPRSTTNADAPRSLQGHRCAPHRFVHRARARAHAHAHAHMHTRARAHAHAHAHRQDCADAPRVLTTGPIAADKMLWVG
jgi:hypothetical protein